MQQTGTRRVEAVVLDLGSVLEIIDDRAFPGPWVERLGLPADGIMSRLEVAMPGSPELGEITEAELRACWRDALALSEEDADGLMEAFWTWYVGRLDVELDSWFRGLQGRGLKVGILSNSCSGAREHERLWGYEDVTDTIVYSHEVGLAKPDPAVYALTAERLGVPPTAVAFLDDVPVNVEAASAAGWQAVLHVSTPASIRALELLIEGQGDQDPPARRTTGSLPVPGPGPHPPSG